MLLRSLVFAGLLVAGLVPGAAHADTLVVLNKTEATASLVDPHSGRTQGTVKVGVGPHEVALSPDGRTAVVANYGDQTPGSSLTVIDIPTAKAVRTIDLGALRRPHGIQWVPGSSVVIITVEQNRAIACVDVKTGTVLETIATDQDISHMVVLSKKADRAYVANIVSGSVTVIDIPTRSIVTQIQTGDGAEGIDITPDGTQVWVTNRSADTVSVIDTATSKVVATMPSPSFPIRARITPDGKHVLVSNAKTATISVFDAKTRTLARTITTTLPAGSSPGGLFAQSPLPIGIVTDPAGKRAYVAHANADAIAILDLQTFTPVGTLTAGKHPDGMAYSTVDVTR